MSGGALGFVLPAVSLGLGAVMFRPSRGFVTKSGTIVAQAVIEESHHDELVITEHPVEQGAPIADHAYKRPAEVVIRCAWSNSPSGSGGFLNNLVGSARGVAATLGGPVVGNILAAGQTIAGVQSLLSGNAQGQIKSIYDQLLELQASRQPFDVLTGKRKYTNMLFRVLSVDTTKATENSLWVVAVCYQVIIVSTTVVTVPINTDPAAQADPEKTMPIQDLGQQQLQPATAFTPDPVSFGSAISDLQGGMVDVQNVLGTVPASDLADITSSAISTLPSALEPAQAALQQVSSSLPGVSEIPLISDPQQLTVSINGALSEAQTVASGAVQSAQSALSTAIRQLPAVLEQVQPAISEAVKQLPAVIDRLPSTFGSLPDLLQAVQGQISDVLRKVPEALSRAPLPTVR